MRTLAIDTSSDVCSVALFDADRLIADDRLAVGRGHAERLIPMIAALPAGGRADRILVDCGPGSFTGIRVGIAAARALGFAWGVPVQGFSSLALIAARWFADHNGGHVTVAIEGGHGQIFVQRFDRGAQDESGFAARPAADLVLLEAPVAGNLGEDRVGPDAVNVLLVQGPGLPVRPLYGRAPDARPIAA